MFDEKNHDRADALGERLERLGGKINPSPELKKAAKTGVPLRAAGIKYTAGTHIRRFSKAVLAYAAGVAILLGGVLLLPRLFEGSGPATTEPSRTTVTTAPSPETCEHEYVISSYVPDDPCTTGTRDEYVCEICGYRYTKSHPPLGHDFVDGICSRCGESELHSPAAIGKMIVSQSNVTFSYKQTYHWDDGTTVDSTILLIRDGNYYYKKIASVSNGIEEESYCDAVEFVEYLYDAQKGVWVKQNVVDVAWDNVCNEYIPEEFFNDAYYELVDGVYTVTEKGLDIYFGDAEISKDYYSKIVWDFTQQDGGYTIRRLISDEDGTVHTELLLNISFGTASITLPNEGECRHEYVSSEDIPTCTEGCTVVHTCTKCGYSYNEQLPASGHEYQQGVCTVCGAGCEHEYEVTGSTFYDCVDGGTVSHSCKHCNDSYIEYLPGRGAHEFDGDTCSVCQLVCYHEYMDFVCMWCGNQHRHEYQTTVSEFNICTEGEMTTYKCKECGYQYVETTPAKGHDYQNNVCTVCQIRKGEDAPIPSDVTKGSVNLLPSQLSKTFPKLDYSGIYRLGADFTPVYYTVYTYFAGYTVTDIRLPVYYGDEGSVFTVRVMKTENGFNTEEIATYELIADRKLEREWALFSGLSIEVPEGCTLVFGWMSDTLELALPEDRFIPGYSYWNDYQGSCGEAILLMEIYGKKN